MRQSARLIVNTMATYVRMFTTVGINLMGTRLLLGVLGPVDFGVVTVLGTTAALGNTITMAAADAARRHLAYEVGLGDKGNVSKTFITTQAVFGGWSLILVIVGALLQPVLFMVLNIPPGRVSAAMCVYFLVLVERFLQINIAPFFALLNAHQRLVTIAVLDTITVVLLFLAVVALIFSSIDLLITYAVLSVIARLLMLIGVALYCWRTYPDCRPRLGQVAWQETHKITGFAGWMVLGRTAFQLRGRASLVLLNIFFNPVVNAAYALAFRTDLYQRSIGSALQNALQPVMTSTEARGDRASLMRMVYLGCKMPLFAGMFYYVPLMVEAPHVLKLWLGSYPDYTEIFVRLVVTASMLFYLGNGFEMAMIARGQVRGVTLISFLLQFSGVGLGVAYFVSAEPDAEPWRLPAFTVVAVTLIVIVYATYVGRIIGLPFLSWLWRVVVPVSVVAVGCFTTSVAVTWCMDSGLGRLLVVTLLNALTAMLLIWVCGLDRQERGYFRDALASLRGRLKRPRQVSSE